MNRFDARQAAMSGEANHSLPDYLQLLQTAIEQAVGTNQRNVHVKLTMQDANGVSLSVEITLNPTSIIDVPQLPQIVEQLPDDVVIMGEEDG